MSLPIIEFTHMSTRLGGTLVHEDIHFKINQGEIFAIVGGSGSGKSTLLREVLGLLQPSTGHVTVYGHDMAHITEASYRDLSKKWGVLFQTGALFSSLTVLENTFYPLREYSHLPPKALKELALSKLLMVGLPLSAAIKFPAELSGGMLKRAALARALILDPALLLLDEPTSGLDPESVSSLDELIYNLKELLNLTVVMVTHDLRTLWHIVDRLAFLGEKKLLALGTPKEVATNPHPMIHNYFHDPESIKSHHGN
ncbi:MAG: ATP-binding cassette domain-containing protein [Gammaproteobacteria bacterium]|nr:ATP-binding cassette domain-containing protein [Gammaproteobacteria bacterium]